MKIIFGRGVMIMMLLFLLFQQHVEAQRKDQACEKAYTLVKLLDKVHYKPQRWDDKLAEQVFYKVIELLDPKSIYFTQQDISELSVYVPKLNKEIQDKSCSFLPALQAVYVKRLMAADSMIDEILRKQLNFAVKDTVTISFKENPAFAANTKELKSRWEKRLKYNTLVHLFQVVDVNDPSFLQDKKILATFEENARQQVKKKEKCKLQKIKDHPNGINNFVVSAFLNAISTSYDPHTIYFTSEEKNEFEASLSKEAYSFGLGLDEDQQGNIEITHLVPGGPAWKSNKLHKGDVLLEVKVPGGEPVDISCSGLLGLDEVVNSTSSKKLEFSVKKLNGQFEKVVLMKEKLEVEENKIKSFILKGEKKIGYISLPGFYTEWEQQNGFGCANDMAKEVLKLKKEKIEGLVLDLRFNGGGSLREALDLAGIFIDIGPLSIQQVSFDDKPSVLKDLNRGTIYDGPLVVMVNGLSASASEIFTAALQDYNRALVVGTPTYGKATGQIILPLDTAFSQAPNGNFISRTNFGFVKVTVEQFFRLTGRSHQREGLQPDVELPDILTSLGYKESASPSALASSKVNKKVFYTPLPSLPVKDLSHKSTRRMATDKKFRQIKLVSDSLGKAYEQGKKIELTMDGFADQLKKDRAFSLTLESIGLEETDLYQVVNNSYDQKVLDVDDYSNGINQELLKDIKEDIYIAETFQIMIDLIHLLNIK